jgi:hypothetical protein
MPISRQARWMRSAISPRLAIRIFSNIAGACPYRALAEVPALRARPGLSPRWAILCLNIDDEQRLAVFDRLAVLDQDLP